MMITHRLAAWKPWTRSSSSTPAGWSSAAPMPSWSARTARTPGSGSENEGSLEEMGTERVVD